MEVLEGSVVLLQERAEGGPGEHGDGLLESFDLLVPGGLPDFEVLEDEVAALMEVRVLIVKLLELAHDTLELLLHLNQRLLLTPDGLSLHRLCIVDDVFDHAHHATASSILLERLELHRGHSSGLRTLCLLDERGLLVEALEH